MNFRLLTEHPASVGETYFEHLGFASRFGGTMILGGLACVVHGVLPFLCTTSGSRRVRALHDKLQRDPGRRRPVTAPAARSEFLDDGSLNWSI
jgi:hypothetical protein